MRRSLGIWVVLVLLTLGGVFDLVQVGGAVLGPGGEPDVLTLQQLITGTLAIISAVGVWRRARWATIAIVAWGVALAVLLATLPIILNLPAEARPGLWGSSGLCFAMAMGMAWYVRRSMSSGPMSGPQTARGA